MRTAKVMLGLSGLLLMSMVLVSFQAAAHPEASAGGIDTAADHAGLNPNADGMFGAQDKSGGMNGNGIAQQPLRHPLCVPHYNDERD